MCSFGSPAGTRDSRPALHPKKKAIVKQTLTEEGAFTSPIKIFSGRFSVQITGTFSGTVTIQRADGSIQSADLEATDYATADTFTAAGAKTGEEGGIAWYRAGFKTGDYTSGSATAEIQTL